jgi:hypothetical protein
MESPKHRTLHTEVGEQVRRLREDASARQEDVAAGARRIGLAWNRATVALVEGGFRQLSAGELLILPLIYKVMITKVLNTPSSNREWPKLADFLPESGLCEVARGCTLPASLLRNVATGKSIFLPTNISVPREADEDTLEEEALGDAEAKAARRFKVSAVEIARMARQLWGRSLTAERDRRLREKIGQVSSRRTLQALRGHVGRTLVAEIAEVVPKTGSEKTAAHDEAARQRRVRRRRRQFSDEQP